MYDASEASRRAHLWELVMITYQRFVTIRLNTCLAQFAKVRSVMGHSGHLRYNQHPAQPLCDKRPRCQNSSRVNIIWGKASALSARVDMAMSETTLHEEGSAQDIAIKGLIKAYEVQLTDIKRELGEQSCQYPIESQAPSYRIST